MPHYKIKNRWTGDILFEGDFDTMRLCVERANLAGTALARANLAGADLAGANLVGANLAGANLYGAYLPRANLAGADLVGANLYGVYLYGANLARANLAGAVIRDGVTLNRAPLRAAQRGDGYTFYLHDTSEGYRVQAGCRWFTFDEAWAHWCGPNAARRGTGLGNETQDILVMFSLALDRVEGGA